MSIKNSSLRYALNNIQITKYFNYEPRFNGVFERDNLPRIKGRVYVINLDNKQSEGTYCVSLFIDKHAALYFDSFGIEYFPQEVLNKIQDKSITPKIFNYKPMTLLYVDFIMLLS